MSNFGEQPTIINKDGISKNKENAEDIKKSLAEATASSDMDKAVEMAGGEKETKMKNFQIQEKHEEWSYGHAKCFVWAEKFSFELGLGSETWQEIANFVLKELKNNFGKDGMTSWGEYRILLKTGLYDGMEVFPWANDCIIYLKGNDDFYHLVKEGDIIKGQKKRLVDGEIKKITLLDDILVLDYRSNSEVGYYKCQKKIKVDTLETVDFIHTREQ